MSDKPCAFEAETIDSLKEIAKHKESLIKIAPHAERLDEMAVWIRWAIRTYKVVKFCLPWVGATVGAINLLSDFFK